MLITSCTISFLKEMRQAGGQMPCVLQLHHQPVLHTRASSLKGFFQEGRVSDVVGS